MIAMARALGKADANASLDFVDALADLQQACNVADVKMSDYGIKRSDLAKYAANARATMGGLFGRDPAPLTDADTQSILEARGDRASLKLRRVSCRGQRPAAAPVIRSLPRP